MALTQEDLLRQQQEKLAGIAQQQQLSQQRAPGQVVGETPEQYAAGKAAGYNLFQQRQAVAAEPQPTRQPQPVVRKQSTPVKTAPVVDPNSATSGMDAVIANMYTSPEQEERMRKASVANQRILAIGDALRHIGNIYNTVNYAPAQKFNSPVLEEQARYERGKALRDAANLRYYSYQQAKAAQDAKAKQWEADYGLKAANYASQAEHRKELARIAGENAASLKAFREGDLARRIKADADKNDYNTKRLEQDRWYKGGRLGLEKRRVADQERRTTAYVNRSSGGGRSNPYAFPTKNGYINLPRDLNTNQIGKKALFGEMKKAGIIDDVWETRYKNMYDAQQQSALLNTAISQWLMNDDKAEDYMVKHFGASPVNNNMDLGLEDDEDMDEDEMNLGLE